jgi:hypothetical protein
MMTGKCLRQGLTSVGGVFDDEGMNPEAFRVHTARVFVVIDEQREKVRTRGER